MVGTNSSAKFNAVLHDDRNLYSEHLFQKIVPTRIVPYLRCAQASQLCSIIIIIKSPSATFQVLEEKKRLSLQLKCFRCTRSFQLIRTGSLKCLKQT